MRFKFHLPLLLMGFALPSYISADTDSPTEEKVIIKKLDLGKRPKAPSLQQIQCTYANQTLSFSFTVDEGQCTVTVSDSMTGTQYHIIESSTPSQIYVGTLTSASITVETETGHTYQGQLN